MSYEIEYRLLPSETGEATSLLSEIFDRFKDARIVANHPAIPAHNAPRLYGLVISADRKEITLKFA
jgi:hypothetical protein